MKENDSGSRGSKKLGGTRRGAGGREISKAVTLEVGRWEFKKTYSNIIYTFLFGKHKSTTDSCSINYKK